MGKKFWGIAGVTLIAVAVIAFFWFVGEYFFSLTADQRMSPAAIRPLIVITLILAMLGFGGVLILRPLFAPEPVDGLTERFRLSREIFLVFSGVFATVIGFYFGALDKPQPNGTVQTASASLIKGDPKVGDDNIIHLETDEAGKPYTVTLLQRANAQIPFEAENPEKTKFRLAFSAAVKECPSDLDVLIADAKGIKSVVKLKIDKAALAAKKWTPCG